MSETTEQLVVVGVDGSKYGATAVEWAETYAAATGASIRYVTSWHWPTSYGAPISFEGFDPQADARTIAEAAADASRLPAGRVSTAVDEGPAGNVLVAESKGAALLVVGTRGHGALTGALLGSTSDYCLRHAHCPVVVVR